jgi:hypothetical protein
MNLSKIKKELASFEIDFDIFLKEEETIYDITAKDKVKEFKRVYEISPEEANKYLSKISLGKNRTIKDDEYNEIENFILNRHTKKNNKPISDNATGKRELTGDKSEKITDKAVVDAKDDSKAKAIASFNKEVIRLLALWPDKTVGKNLTELLMTNETIITKGVISDLWAEDKKKLEMEVAKGNLGDTAGLKDCFIAYPVPRAAYSVLLFITSYYIEPSLIFEYDIASKLSNPAINNSTINAYIDFLMNHCFFKQSFSDSIKKRVSFMIKSNTEASDEAIDSGIMFATARLLGKKNLSLKTKESLLNQNSNEKLLSKKDNLSISEAEITDINKKNLESVFSFDGTRSIFGYIFTRTASYTAKETGAHSGEVQLDKPVGETGSIGDFIQGEKQSDAETDYSNKKIQNEKDKLFSLESGLNLISRKNQEKVKGQKTYINADNFLNKYVLPAID